MKKVLSFILSALLLLSCLSGFALTASAEGAMQATLIADDLASGRGLNQLTVQLRSWL